jgi:tRNA 2-selenouridine synthase
MRRRVKFPDVVTVAQLAEFDEVIDARSEGEFAEDHVPGALNCPVLDDAERARVGTLYKQVSPFAAKRTGAALVSRNIARWLESRFADKPRTWRPLVYCWRGGSRSGAFTHVLRQVGWPAAQLDGGYRAFRRAVIADLEALPVHFRWHVICGHTGTGKSRLLRALAARGAQVLDLEGLAAHRGSVLGNLPDAPQPPQKLFESRVWAALQAFDRTRPVYVEAESKKIGNLRVPECLIANMWASECVRVQASLATRVALLIDEYAHFIAQPDLLVTQLRCLTALHGAERIGEWEALAREGRWETLVAGLLESHYDPAYTRSTLRHYPRYGEARVLHATGPEPARFDALARECLATAAP